MKKQSRSFITEIKRPRLALSPGTTPRIVWPADPQEPSREPPSLVVSAPITAGPDLSRKERRVLPDLGAPKQWKEPDAPEPVAHAPPSPPIKISAPRARAKLARRADEPEVVVPRESAPPAASQLPRRKTAPWGKRSLEDLPRGQRWKRHLPKSAW